MKLLELLHRRRDPSERPPLLLMYLPLVIILAALLWTMCGCITTPGEPVVVKVQVWRVAELPEPVEPTCPEVDALDPEQCEATEEDAARCLEAVRVCIDRWRLGWWQVYGIIAGHNAAVRAAEKVGTQ